MNTTMKTIEVDEELYRYIASNTQDIGESASDILRRLLMLSDKTVAQSVTAIPASTLASEVKNITSGSKRDRVKSLRSLLISEAFVSEEKSIARFMMILTTLYTVDATSFSDAAAFKGRTRVYFSENEQTLLASGKTTKPKMVPDTPFWVITNTNTDRKRQMVEQLMEKMHFNSDIIEKVCSEI